MHLSDEQFENVLQASPEPNLGEHLSQCPACQGGLAQRRAIRDRLRRSFAGAAPSTELRQRIARSISQAPAEGQAGRTRQGGSPIILLLRRRLVPALAAAAALGAAAAGLTIYFSGRPSASAAAREQLVEIHKSNLSAGHELFVEDEPAKLARYFKERLGFSPLLPRLNQGMAIRGCCVAHFRGRIVGSYVVNTPHGVVSIIVVTDEPASIGLAPRAGRGGQTVWTGGMGMCNLAAVRLGQYTYTAVGETSADSLSYLLELLVPPPLP